MNYSDEQIELWLDYMTTQKILIHFRPLFHVPPHMSRQFCGERGADFPIFQMSWGTYNHPKINVLSLDEFFNSGADKKWINQQKTPNKPYDSSCNYLR